jgi:hypothetical protein
VFVLLKFLGYELGFAVSHEVNSLEIAQGALKTLPPPSAIPTKPTVSRRSIMRKPHFRGREYKKVTRNPESGGRPVVSIAKNFSGLLDQEESFWEG